MLLDRLDLTGVWNLGDLETDTLYVVIMFTHDDKQSFFLCLALIKLIIQKYVNMQMVKHKKKLKHAHD